MERQLETYQKIERSIIKKFRKQLWTPFIVAVKRYELIQAGDKIAVCISGGKDSMLMAKLLQELQRHSEVPFELVYLVMDPGYNEINRQKIESNAALLHIPITVLRRTSLMSPTTVTSRPATSAPGCAAATYTRRRRNLAAIKSRWGITSMTSSRRRS